MLGRIAAFLLLISIGCGGEPFDSEAPVDDAGPGVDSGDDGGENYEDASAPPECRTHPVDADADPEIHAALCIAMSEPGEFECTGDDARVTCIGRAGAIVVLFDPTGKGAAHYATATQEIGTVTPRDDGFDLSLSEGKTGVCTVEGALVELCVY